MLFLLLFLLIFEGILRKIIPPLSTLIFFFKDFICIRCLFLIGGNVLPTLLNFVRTLWFKIFIFFIPLLFYTISKDPFLAIFAAKQYLLYPVVGLLLPLTFSYIDIEAFKKFIFITSVMLIPTTMVAILQNSLPPTHWLNLSVGGESLAGFAAAGYLRVSSTFSFTGQYSWFLNAESYFLIVSLVLPPSFRSNFFKKLIPVVYMLLSLMIIIGAFITGGRTAVLGCGLTLALGSFFIFLKNPNWFMLKGIPIFFLIIIALGIIRSIKPEFFLAYEARSSGNEEVSHNDELADRVFGGFIDWTDWFWEQSTASVFLGNGLGVMSNGSNQISSYAAEIRSTGLWTEGDVPTTFWEGGLYLAFIWYGFRVFVITFCLRLWYSFKINKLATAGAVPLAYVIIIGLIGQLGYQPPLAIWWWLAIGIIMYLKIFELNKIKTI